MKSVIIDALDIALIIWVAISAFIGVLSTVVIAMMASSHFLFAGKPGWATTVAVVGLLVLCGQGGFMKMNDRY